MPIFEFVCRTCGLEFEELIKARNEMRQSCPKCGGKEVEKRFSPFAAHDGRRAAMTPVGGCGRCGDPYGPCGLNHD